MRIKCLLLYFFIIIHISVNYPIYVYEPYFVLNFLNNNFYNENNLQFMIDRLSKTFNDCYTFNEISKSPPNPYFSQNYYKKVDIQKLLKEIQIKNRSLYSFYQDLTKTLFELGDLHIKLDLSYFLSLYTQIYMSQPLKLYIKMYNNRPRIFGQPLHSSDFWKYFKNSSLVYNVIKNNLKVPIYSINGKDPFDYISNFGGIYNNLKSPYSTFVYKFFNHNYVSFYSYPLSLEDLTNFTVVYDSNDTFTTDFIITSSYNISALKSQNSLNNFKGDEKKGNLSDSSDYLLMNDSLNNEKLKISSNYIFNKDNSFDEVKINNDNEIMNNNVIQWNYNYSSLFKCRVDEKNKVNVYFINKFGDSEIIDGFSEIILKCAELFDTNKYPVILITSFNPGGKAFLSQILLELLSPKITLNMYGSFRKTDTFKNSSELNQFLSFYTNLEDCKTLTYDHLMKKEHIIKYDDNISSTLTEPFIILRKDIKKQLNSIKKNFKNPRNPTDILVYTDGFSYSTASLFLKYLQYYGGAITTGYFYNPNLDLPFDSSLSPSLIFDYLRLQILSPEGYKPFFDNFNIILSLPGIQTFYTPDNLTIPLEYQVTPVDEKVNIFEAFSDSNYDIFINESLKILNKYKTECNPNNKKLVLLSSECDSSFKNKYTHGGYECGNDGKWSNKCVPSYCDIGYIFDYNKNECIIDVCSDEDRQQEKEEEKKENNNENQNNSLKYIIISLIVVFLLIFIIIAIFIIKRIKRKNSPNNTIQNISLVDKFDE